jgi:hypothetical protein
MHHVRREGCWIVILEHVATQENNAAMMVCCVSQLWWPEPIAEHTMTVLTKKMRRSAVYCGCYLKTWWTQYSFHYSCSAASWALISSVPSARIIRVCESFLEVWRYISESQSRRGSSRSLNSFFVILAAHHMEWSERPQTHGRDNYCHFLVPYYIK